MIGGIDIARRLLLLGAECAVATPDTEVIDAHRGWPARTEAWAALGREMKAHGRGELEAPELDELSYWLVMIAAATELHPEAAAAASLIAEDERTRTMTASCFARLMAASSFSAYDRALAEALPGAHVERLGLIERLDSPASKPRVEQGLRLTNAALHALFGAEDDRELPASLVARCEPPADECVFPADHVERAARLLAERDVLCVRAAAARVARQLAIDLGTVIGEGTWLVTASDDPLDARELARLHGGAVALDLFAVSPAKLPSETWLAGLARDRHPLLVLLPHSTAVADLAAIDVESFDPRMQRRIWRLGTGRDEPERARKFRASLEELRAAVRAAEDERFVRGDRSALASEAIEAQILAQGSRRMGRMVTRLPARAKLDDLVANEPLRRALLDIVGWHRVAGEVETEWRVADRSGLGRGLTCLFSGSPGTGKTFAAQCLAAELRLNLYRIDLSQVVSKYIGETEKALSRVFDEADAGHGILLFDEADALFGKRTEVKDAHDRYANVEVGYLLQRMEAFEGVSILTTNLRNNLDAAFLRRLRFILEFPMPDGAMRRRLWEQSLPPRDRWAPDVPLDDLVERFPLSGGSIHNIGLAAAHLAAADGQGRLTAAHLARATLRELEKCGLGRSREEMGSLAAHLSKGEL